MVEEVHDHVTDRPKICHRAGSSSGVTATLATTWQARASTPLLHHAFPNDHALVEWCVWLGYAVYSLAFWPHGVIALLGQAIIIGSIFGVTGIPPTENQAIRSKGDAYREYQKRVSRFVPLPPKPRRNEA